MSTTKEIGSGAQLWWGKYRADW